MQNVLYNTEENEFKVHCNEQGQKFVVSAIQLFKTGVEPAWEDEVNKKGAEFRVEIKN